MTVKSGLGSNLYIDGVDLSGDIGALSAISSRSQLLSIPSIDVSGQKRIHGRRDGEISFNSWFNDAAAQEHLTLRGQRTADRIASWFQAASALGDPVASMVCKQVNYDPTLGQDGSLAMAIQALATQGVGLEWGEALTAGKRTDSGATNGSGYDFGASSAFGLAAYLHVFEFTGTDVTIKLQESSDDGSGDAYGDVTGGGFAEVTSGPTFERIVTSLSQSVEQWLRVVTTTSGGFSNLVFAVAVVRFSGSP